MGVNTVEGECFLRCILTVIDVSFQIDADVCLVHILLSSRHVEVKASRGERFSRCTLLEVNALRKARSLKANAFRGSR